MLPDASSASLHPTRVTVKCSRILHRRTDRRQQLTAVFARSTMSSRTQHPGFHFRSRWPIPQATEAVGLAVIATAEAAKEAPAGEHDFIAELEAKIKADAASFGVFVFPKESTSHASVKKRYEGES